MWCRGQHRLSPIFLRYDIHTICMGLKSTIQIGMDNLALRVSTVFVHGGGIDVKNSCSSLAIELYRLIGKVIVLTSCHCCLTRYLKCVYS